MELLDVYDEKGNFLKTEDRNIIHREGLWHKTVHCWLYDQKGNVFFQVRKDRGTLYTTSSGHLLAGETIAQGFQREIKEEIGISIDASDAKLVGVVPFQMDLVKKDGSIFKDRAFANVYIDLYEGNYEDFHMDPEEVSAIAIVPAKETLEMFQKGSGSVKGLLINNKNQKEEKEFMIDDFLLNEGETLLSKYGEVLEAIIQNLA